MRRGDAVFPGLVLAFAATVLAIGYFHYHYTWTAFGFPFAAGAALCLLCALEMRNVISRRGAPAADTAPTLSPGAMAWLFALAAFLYGLGFVFGTALYLLVCLRGNGFTWRLAALTALASLPLTWGLFIKVLGVQLPLQPLWFG